MQVHVRKSFIVLCINVIIFASILFLLEGVSRLIFSFDSITPMFNDESLRTRLRPYMEKHPTRGFALKRGFSNGVYSVNSEGFRGPEFPNDLNEKFIILTLGESTTFGWEVKDNETYPFYLSDFLNPKKTYVVNGGTPSYSSSQVLAYLKEIISNADLDLDFVLINILWNDIWYSTVKNWHSNILIYQKPPGWIDFLTKNSRLVRILVMGTNKNRLTDIFNEKALKQYIKNLNEMLDICRKNNISVALVQPPFDADHMPEMGLNEFHIRYTKKFLIATGKRYTDEMLKLAENRRVHVVEHRLDLSFLNQEALFLDSLHPTPKGNAMIAEDIYNQLKNNILFGLGN